MPVAKPVYLWEADVDLEVRNIAFSAQAEKKKEGAKEVTYFGLPCLEDGTLYWNPAQRLKGWIKNMITVLRSGLLVEVQGGIKVYPVDGGIDKIDIAKVSELEGTEPPPGRESGVDYKLPNGLPYPKHQFAVVQGNRSVEMLWYVLPKTIPISLKVVSFTRTIEPVMIEDTLKKLGSKVGLGDKYASGSYGLFEVKRFEVTNRERLGIGG